MASKRESDVSTQYAASGASDDRRHDDEGSIGSLTPRASRDGNAQSELNVQSQRSIAEPQAPENSNGTTSSSRAPSTLHGDGVIESSTTANSFRTTSYTTNDYASSIATETSLLPHGSEGRWNTLIYPRRRSEAPITKSRKVYMAVCDAVQVAIPMDMNDDATSMRESSIYKRAKSVQNGLQKTRRRTSVPS